MKKRTFIAVCMALSLAFSFLTSCSNVVSVKETEVVLTQEELQKLDEIQVYIDKFANKDINKGDLQELNIAIELYEALDDNCKAKLGNENIFITKYGEYNQKVASGVDTKIDEIYPMDYPSKGKIETAQSAYDALTDEQKELVTKADILANAENDYNQFLADIAIELIDAIPSEVTYENREEVFDAYQAYEKLTDEQKSLVTNGDEMSGIMETYSASCIARYNELLGSLNTVTVDSYDTIEELKSIYLCMPSETKEEVDYSALLDKDKEYTLAVAKQTFEESKISKGDILKKGTIYSSEFKSCQITTTLLPAKTSGYYWYYTAPDGFYYVDTYFYVTNVSSTIQGTDGFIDSATLYVDGVAKTVAPEFYSSSDSYIDMVTKYDGISYNSGTMVHVVFRITEAEKKDSKSIAVELVAGANTVYAIAK